MTDEEFIKQARDIFNRWGANSLVCRPPDSHYLYLGFMTYMRRSQLVEIAEEIFKLEGYTIKEVRKEDGKRST